MDFKKDFIKYLKHWPWFLLSLTLFSGAAYFYVQDLSPTYLTSALINFDITKDKEAEVINTDASTEIEKNDLSREKMYITSNRFLSQIVTDLKLNINYFEKGHLQKKVLYDVPFVITSKIPSDSLPEITFNVKIVKEGIIVGDASKNKQYLIRGHKSNNVFVGIPIKIELTSKAQKNLQNYLDKDYVVEIEPTQVAVNKLKYNLTITSFESPSTDLSLTHKGINPILSIEILDKIIATLDNDIVANKQKKLVKSVSYLSQLIAVFSREKDSIERLKESYLRTNNIYVLDQYISTKTNDKIIKTENSLSVEKQIALTRYAINDVRNSNNTSALGTDYNLDAPAVNQMLQNYNTSLMDSELLLQRAQVNNPAYISVAAQLKAKKQAVLNALGDYLNQLNQTNVVNKREQNNAVADARSIPTKDKELGEINSNLKLKEDTYLALLSKREKAILNSNNLESNLSVVDSPQTDYSSMSPQPKSFMLGSFLFAIILPFGIIYVSLWMDTKIHNQDDIEKVLPNVPQLGYIPQIDSKEKLDNSATSRSLIAEATRTLVSNISYLLPRKKDNKGAVILFTSSIQGEGKSFCAFHAAVSLSNHNKKVLLIGVDLRNPQLHEYFSLDRNILGLTHFLSNKTDDWQGFLQRDISFSKNLDVLLAGEIPPNPTQLISNSNIESLIEQAKNFYDIIVLDSSPIQLVSDTLNISHLADVTVFVVKYDFTDKNSLVEINNFIKKDQLKNVGILINGVNMKTSSGYGYGRASTYQYQEVKKKKPWYKRA